jgi:hypothetical protein
MFFSRCNARAYTASFDKFQNRRINLEIRIKKYIKNSCNLSDRSDNNEDKAQVTTAQTQFHVGPFNPSKKRKKKKRRSCRSRTTPLPPAGRHSSHLRVRLRLRLAQHIASLDLPLSPRPVRFRCSAELGPCPC